MRPSQNMPAPLNMRRTSTGRKLEKSSRMKSASTTRRWLVSLGPFARCGRELDGFAAAAGRGLVRVVEHELRGHLVDLVIHLGAKQEQHGLRVDQDAHALFV